MNTRRFQGLALVISAVCLFVGLFGSGTPLFHVISLIGTLLFIFGIPVLLAVQPTGSSGLAGIVLLELGALLALAFQLDIIPSPSLGSGLSLTSAIVGMAGRVIIGWLNTRKKVFPAWVGWAFLAGGLLNFLGGVINIGSLANMESLIAILSGAAALFGYGFVITREQKPSLYGIQPILFDKTRK